MSKKENLLKHVAPTTPASELTEGGAIYGGGNAADFKTGDWRTAVPEWHPDKCKQCLLCYPVCPDSAIPVKDSKRLDFDFDHCKGCGICYAVCPFGAISYHTGEED